MPLTALTSNATAIRSKTGDTTVGPTREKKVLKTAAPTTTVNGKTITLSRGRCTAAGFVYGKTVAAVKR